MKRIEILGVGVHAIDHAQAIQWAEEKVKTPIQKPQMVVTPNPEIILFAHRHSEFRRVLNAADLALPDGRGLRLVSPLSTSVPGADFADALLSLAGTYRLRIFCIVRKDGRSSLGQVIDVVQHLAPEALVSGMTVTKEHWDHPSVIEELKREQPQIVFVGLGFPEQEYWLARYLPQISSARIGIGIGGVFDYWTGVASRAPLVFRRLGLEWLWRVAHEPRRVRRIFRAVVVFPLTVWWQN